MLAYKLEKRRKSTCLVFFLSFEIELKRVQQHNYLDYH